MITISKKRPQDEVPDEVIERCKDLQLRNSATVINGLNVANERLRKSVHRVNAVNFAQFRIIRDYAAKVTSLCKMLKKQGQYVPADIEIFNEEVKKKLLKK